MPCHPDRLSPLPTRYQFGDGRYPPDETYTLTIEQDETGAFVRFPFVFYDAENPGGPAIERIYLPTDVKVLT